MEIFAEEEERETFRRKLESGISLPPAAAAAASLPQPTWNGAA